MTQAAEKPAQDTVAAYKTMLAAIIDRRPSGTRQRLAVALAKNRSFVSHITNPAYATPIPVTHLTPIFEICHFSAAERQEFMRLYAQAHPRRMKAEARTSPTFAVHLPDLGDEARNRKLHGLVSGFVRELARLIGEVGEEGKQR